MIRARFVALLCLVLSFSAVGQSANWSTGVIYEYDGSGNVKKIGTDAYLYDTAQRLIRGSVAGSQQSYTYDSFGNRKACQPAVAGDCQYGFTVDSSTNRVEGRLYDKRGNMLQLPEGNTLEYDELGMVRKENGNGRTVYYIYTAADERIAVYEADTKLSTHEWEWTVRGLDKKPLREFTSEGSSGTASFKWVKDHIWRDSVLLASRQADAGAPGGLSTYHYHVDHLGTPRQVTNSASVIIGRHDYLPFGPELTSTRINEPKLEDLKFTGHERDEARDRPPLDYMHARYYEPRLGRFLSVDPLLDAKEAVKSPQMWNRYSYVQNNPVNLTDPDGKQAVGLMVSASRDWQEVQSGEITLEEANERASQRLMGVTAGVGGAGGLRALGGYLMRNPQVALSLMGFGTGVTGGVAPSSSTSQIHHIATNKNFAGGFTKQFEAIFAKAGMNLSDSANLMSLPGHAGRHSPGYHKHVLDTLQKATKGLSGKAYKEALTGALNKLRKELKADPDLVKMK